jgi:hypothetical protein
MNVWLKTGNNRKANTFKTFNTSGISINTPLPVIS